MKYEDFFQVGISNLVEGKYLFLLIILLIAVLVLRFIVNLSKSTIKSLVIIALFAWIFISYFGFDLAGVKDYLSSLFISPFDRLPNR